MAQIQESSFTKIHSLTLTANAPENRPVASKGNDCIPIIHFQVLLLLVSGRVMVGKNPTEEVNLS